MTTQAQLLEIFEGPISGIDTSPTSQDWLLPLWQQPSYPYAIQDIEYLPEPAPRTGGADWLTTLSKPFVDFGTNLWKTSQKTVESTYEKLPELLWGWGLEKAGIIDRPKQVVVNEGAGVTVTHSQPPHAGGEPAQPIVTTIPQILPASMVPAGAAIQEKGISTIILIGAGLLVLYVLFKG